MLNPFYALCDCQDDSVTKNTSDVTLMPPATEGIKVRLRLGHSSAVCYSKIVTSTSFNMQFATKFFTTVVAVASVVSALPNVDTPVSVVAVRLISDD